MNSENGNSSELLAKFETAYNLFEQMKTAEAMPLLKECEEAFAARGEFKLAREALRMHNIGHRRLHNAEPPAEDMKREISYFLKLSAANSAKSEPGTPRPPAQTSKSKGVMLMALGILILVGAMLKLCSIS